MGEQPTKRVASYQFTSDPDVHEQLANARKQIKNLKKALKSAKKQLQQQKETSKERRDERDDKLRSCLAAQEALIRRLREKSQQDKRQLKVAKSTIRDFETAIVVKDGLGKKGHARRQKE